MYPYIKNQGAYVAQIPMDLLEQKYFRILFSSHVMVNASKIGVFVFAYLNFGMIDILMWLIVCGLFLFVIVWRNSQYCSAILERYYKSVEILFHVLFHAYFIYSAVYFGQFELFMFEVAIYWTFELILVIFREQSKFKEELERLAADHDKTLAA